MVSLKDLSKPSRDGPRRPRKQVGKRRKKGRPRGSRNKLTTYIQRRAELDVAKRAGKLRDGMKLAVDWLRDIAAFAAEGMRHYRMFDAAGQLRKEGDTENFFRFAELLRDAAVPLAQYETPKLGAVAIAQAPSADQHMVMHVNIFNDHGEHVEEVIDGETQPLLEDRKRETP